MLFSGIDLHKRSLVIHTPEVLVLRALAPGEKHGLEIITWLEQRSGGVLELEDGTLYHAKRRNGRSTAARFRRSYSPIPPESEPWRSRP